MDRSKYLRTCQEASVCKGICVRYHGEEYTPRGYIMLFDNGVPKHSALLRKGNSETQVRLEEIE